MMHSPTLPISLPYEKIVEFCQQHSIQQLSLFGSVLRDDFHDQSDIDLLVEFDPNHVPGYITLAGMEIELTNLIGRKVDLRTPGELSRYFRQRVLETAQIIYVHR